MCWWASEQVDLVFFFARLGTIEKIVYRRTCVFYQGVNKHSINELDWMKGKSTPRYILLCYSSLLQCSCLFSVYIAKKIGYLGKGQWSFIHTISVCYIILFAFFCSPFPTTHVLSLSLFIALFADAHCIWFSGVLRSRRRKPDLCFLPMFAYNMTSHSD